MKRRILTEIQLDKIAAVDFPCQEHARVTILKREQQQSDQLVAKIKALHIMLAQDKINKLRKQVLMEKISLLHRELNKTWHDEARAASQEARQNASDHFQAANQHREAAQGSRGFSLKAHTEAGRMHQRAGDTHDAAAREYANGSTTDARILSATANAIGARAHALSGVV